MPCHRSLLLNEWNRPLSHIRRPLLEDTQASFDTYAHTYLSNESISGLVKGDVTQQWIALDDVGAAAALALEVFLCVPMCS